MRIMICGASGMIGSALFSALEKDHSLTLVGRTPLALSKRFLGVDCISWEQLNSERLASQDVVINLSGENIGNKRWAKSQKEKILNSRVESTHAIASICALLGKDSPRIFNASAIGAYGLPKSFSSIAFDESSSLPLKPSDFLSRVGVAWEGALKVAEDAGVNVVKLRFGVVLSPDGGALKKMLPSFRLGLGAKIGSGMQPFSWVTLSDVVLAIKFLLEHSAESGAFNIVGGEVVTQFAFAKALASHLHKPLFMCLPARVIKLLFGQMGEELLLSGQDVKALRLHALGFEFSYPTLSKALDHLF